MPSASLNLWGVEANVSLDVNRNGVVLDASAGAGAESKWKQLETAADIVHAVEDCERDIAKKLDVSAKTFDMFRDLNWLIQTLSPDGTDLPALLRQLPIDTGGVKVFFKVSGSVKVSAGLSLKVGMVEAVGDLGKVKKFGGSGQIPLVGGKGYFGYEAESTFQGKEHCVYLQKGVSSGGASGTIQLVIAYSEGDVPKEMLDVAKEVRILADQVSQMSFPDESNIVEKGKEVVKEVVSKGKEVVEAGVSKGKEVVEWVAGGTTTAEGVGHIEEPESDYNYEDDEEDVDFVLGGFAPSRYS